MASLSFAQISYSWEIAKGGTVNSASTLARALGYAWPLPRDASLRFLLSEAVSAVRGPSGVMNVTSIMPPDEPPPQTYDVTPGTGYVLPPAELAESPLPPGQPGTGRPALMLRETAGLKNGNQILYQVAGLVVKNLRDPGNAVSQVMLTAMTQLAATGSNAFMNWAWKPTQEQNLTAYFESQGLTSVDAAKNSQKIMSDFNAARLAVRNPRAGIDAASLRAGMGPQGAVPPNLGWIAVSGEDDPPDYPVNVQIASHQCQCPQFHQSIIVDGINLDIRYLIASSQGQTWTQPQIPAGNEVIIFIHGEGSRAEEALDLIPALFSAGEAAGRHITVVALDLPGSGYTTRVKAGVSECGEVRDTPVHTEVALLPAISGPALVDTSPFIGAPVLDFVEHTISAFVETVVVPFGNPVKAVVGGSLGGHMAMRFAASQKPWVQNVVAWSPASMWEYDLFLLGVDAFPHRVLANPVLSGSAAEAESMDSRGKFLASIWDQNLFPPSPADKFELDAATVAAGVIFAGIVPNVITVAGAAALAAAIIALPTLPPQPEMWYRDDWPPLDGSGNSLPKGSFINATRMDRQEGYNENMRKWHFRICLETIGYKFDTTFAASVQKPLLLMVGEKDDYPMVHFLKYVKAFAGTLTGPGQALTVQDTGHSIQSERPAFLADQILRFTR